MPKTQDIIAPVCGARARLRCAIKSLVGPAAIAKISGLRNMLGCYKEQILGGGPHRERLLLDLLGRYYTAKYRREWILSAANPHFFDHRLGFFAFAFGNAASGPYPYYRAFFSSEVLKQNDRVLDIGCGDGFFDRRFFADRCSFVDAIDIEPTAIEAAKLRHSSPRITYYLMDATSRPFPHNEYDVIVWDGALGHFSADTTMRMIGKIVQALASDGVFVGSESLGEEGEDHLQYFASLTELAELFQPHFRHVLLRKLEYEIGMEQRFLRTEAYWRCSNRPDRLAECSWREFGC